MHNSLEKVSNTRTVLNLVFTLEYAADKQSSIAISSNRLHHSCLNAKQKVLPLVLVFVLEAYSEHDLQASD